MQNSSEAVAMLRYFYEKRPDIYVIAAGSLLENVIDRKISFPVGRVECLVYPTLNNRLPLEVQMSRRPKLT